MEPWSINTLINNLLASFYLLFNLISTFHFADKTSFYGLISMSDHVAQFEVHFFLYYSSLRNCDKYAGFSNLASHTKEIYYNF